MARTRKALAADAAVPARFDLILRGLDAPDADIAPSSRDRVRVRTLTTEPDVYNRRVAMLVSLHERLHRDAVRELRADLFDVAALEVVYGDGSHLSTVAAWVELKRATRDTLTRAKAPSAGLAALVDTYIEQEGGRSPEQKRRKLVRLTDYLGGPAADVAMLTRNTLAEYLSKLTLPSKAAPRDKDGTYLATAKRAFTDVKVTDSTYNRHLDTIRGFCRWAKRAGHLAVNPYDDKGVPKRDENDSRITLLSPAETAEYLREVYRTRPQLVLALELLMHTGIDVEELDKLQTQHVHFDDDGGAELQVRRNKTRTPERHVPVPTHLVAALRGIIALFGYKGTDRVFSHITRRMLRTHHERARATIHRTDMRLKDHRHMAAVYWRKAGFDIQQISTWLGHATIQQTTIYTAFGKDHKADRARIDAAAALLAADRDVVPMIRPADVISITTGKPSRATGTDK